MQSNLSVSALSLEVQKLVAAAMQASKTAYAPYSKFMVGAAVALKDGTIVSGSNFENVSYGVTICAETAAFSAVNSLGNLKAVRAVAIYGTSGSGVSGQGIVRPCGRCRQVMSEVAMVAGHDIDVVMISSDGLSVERSTAGELLPLAFNSAGQTI